MAAVYGVRAGGTTDKSRLTFYEAMGIDGYIQIKLNLLPDIPSNKSYKNVNKMLKIIDVSQFCGINALRLVVEVFSMTGKRFLSFLAHRGIPASCLAQRLGCQLSSIKNLKSCDKVPRHYVNMLIREFGMYLTGNDVDRLKGV